MKRKSDLSFVMYAALLIIISFFSISIISPSCKKMDVRVGSDVEIQSRFFNVPNSAPVVVHKVAAALKKQNDIGGFIPSFAKKEGYAIWEKSLIHFPEPLTRTYGRDGEFETQDTIEVFTPIVLDNGNMVNGFFFSRIVGDSVALHLYRANDYDIFPTGKIDSSVVTAELIIIKLLQLNDEIFGHRKYELLDSNAFKKAIAGTFRTIELDTNSNNNGGSETGRTKVTDCGFTCYYYQTPECISTTNWCTFCQLSFCYSDCPVTPGGGGGTGTGNPTGGGYNWPPDPPMGGGGTGGSGGGGSGSGGSGGGSTGNCTTGNCGTGGTILVEGRVPCGGCGSGPIALPPDIPIPPSTIDTCADAQNLAKKMDTLYLKLKIDSMLSTMPGWENYSYEKGFPGYKRIQISGGIVSITNYFPGPIQSGLNMDVKVAFDSASATTKASMQVHLHTKGGYAAPSAGDYFSFVTMCSTWNNTNIKLRYDGSVIASPDGSKYSIGVTDLGKAFLFLTEKNANYDSMSHHWKEGSDMGKVFDKANKYYYGSYSSISDSIIRDDRAVEMAHATVLTKFNSGIRLLKKDSTGKFKPIIVDAQVDPLDSTKMIYTQKCL